MSFRVPRCARNANEIIDAVGLHKSFDPYGHKKTDFHVHQPAFVTESSTCIVAMA